MSEGQPALTPEVAARWASEARMATGQNDHLWANRMSTALAELAREREARKRLEERNSVKRLREMESELAREREATETANAVLRDALELKGQAEGRVRELQEERDRERELVAALDELVSATNFHPHSVAAEEARAKVQMTREALVGLPE